MDQGRIWTLLTTALSVDSGWGLLFNGFTLWFLGNAVAQQIGTKYFLPIYFGSSIAAGAAHLAYYGHFANEHASVNQRLYNKHISMQGATASTMAIAAVYAAMWPRRSIHLYGVLPVPAALLVGGFFAWSVYQSQTSHRPVIGDIVGPLVGVASFFLIRRRIWY